MPFTRGDFLAGAASTTVALASPLPVPSALPTGSPSLSVYHVRDDVKRATAILPGELLQFKGVHVVEVTDVAAIASAQAAIDAAHAVGRDEALEDPLDARWGLRFATATGRFVHSVYCDARGTAAQVDGRRVVFSNGAALIAYLEKTFGPA